MVQFHIDRYTHNRGEPAQIEIWCSRCDTYLITYQKDGGGDLLRCYFDRIHEPEKLKDLHKQPIEKCPSILKCPSCDNIVGYVYTYVSERKQEKRPAFLLVESAFSIAPHQKFSD